MTTSDWVAPYTKLREVPPSLIEAAYAKDIALVGEIGVMHGKRHFKIYTTVEEALQSTKKLCYLPYIDDAKINQFEQEHEYLLIQSQNAKMSI